MVGSGRKVVVVVGRVTVPHSVPFNPCFVQEVMRQNAIGFVLNASHTCPQPPFIADAHFLRVPVNDSFCEKILPWLDRSLDFIGEWLRHLLLLLMLLFSFFTCFCYSSTYSSSSSSLLSLSSSSFLHTSSSSPMPRGS